MSPIIRILEKISKALEVVAYFITVALMIFLTLLIFVSVIARFIFNSPVDWQYEATLLCMSWVVFVGMSLTFKAKEHMALTFVTNVLPPKTRAVWMTVIDIVLIAFLLIALKEGIAVTQQTWRLNYLTIPVKKGLFYLAFPVGSAFSIVHLVLHILKRKPSDYMSEDSTEKLLKEG